MKRLIVFISAVFMLFGFVGAASASNYFEDVKDTWYPLGIPSDIKWVAKGDTYSYTHDLSSLTEPIVDAAYELDFTNLGDRDSIIDVSFDGGATWYKDYSVNQNDVINITLTQAIVDMMNLTNGLTVTVYVHTGSFLKLKGASIDHLKVDGHTVPIPGAIWLLGSGLVGLVGLRRRKRKG